MFLLVINRHKVRQSLEQRQNHETNESRLGCSHIGITPITEHAHWKFVFLFYIALLEEFLEQQISPVFDEIKRPGGLRNVAGVDHKIHDLLLVDKQAKFVDFSILVFRVEPVNHV